MKTFKFKLYGSKKNKFLNQKINIAGMIWNHCIALHKRYFRLYGKSLNVFQLMKHITKRKKLARYSFWKEVDAQAIQDIVERIDRSYQLFFRNLKQGIKTAPPKFKKVRFYTSITLKQTGWKLLGSNGSAGSPTNRIKIQGKTFKFFKSRNIPTDSKTVTIKRDSLGDFYLYFVVDVDSNQENQVKSGNIAGFDFGLKTFLTSSDCEKIESPLFYKQALEELKKAQQNLSSKKKGSNHYKKAKLAVARIHAHITNQRKDFFF